MDRWWKRKDEGMRKDITDALTALRQEVENANTSPSVVLTHLGAYRQRQLTEVRTTRVGEWHFGYKVEEVDRDQGFFIRTVFIKLLGGRLDELNQREREQIIHSVAGSALDRGTQVMLTQIADDAMVIRQPFAVMFAHEQNTNIVTPSKRLLLKSFDPSQIKPPNPNAPITPRDN